MDYAKTGCSECWPRIEAQWSKKPSGCHPEKQPIHYFKPLIDPPKTGSFSFLSNDAVIFRFDMFASSCVHSRAHVILLVVSTCSCFKFCSLLCLPCLPLFPLRLLLACQFPPNSLEGSIRDSRFDLCQKLRIRVFASVNGLLPFPVPRIVPTVRISTQLKVGLKAIVEYFGTADGICATLRRDRIVPITIFDRLFRLQQKTSATAGKWYNETI